MRRHLDDHPSLSNSSSGVFNSNSLPLSAANPSNTVSRIFPDLEARSGASNSNIPLTTVNTSTPATPSLTFHHSSRTLTAPVSPGAGNNSNKPLIPRQPLALIQETVHAVGTGGNSEMQSGLQFSLPSGYQARVAAATTLSQGGLGHSQSSSTVHHTSLPVQAQAHSNTQIVHPIQTNSQAHAAAQMQGHQFQKLKVEDALSYLDQVKYKFGSQPQVYNDFLDIMKEFKSQSIDTPGVIQRVSNLFRGHPELIVGFNTFLPLGYRIEVQPNEQVQVSIPGTNLGPGGISTGPTSLTILPSGPPTVTPIHPTHNSQSNHSSHTTSPHSPPGNAVSNHPPPVANSQPHTNSQSQHGYNQNSPAHTQSSGGSPGGHSPNSTPQTSQPVEFNHAINYVNKIKNRFQGHPDIYKQFLEILHTYQKEQRNLKDGGLHTPGTKPLTEAEVYAQVAKLFQAQEDLLHEFGQFLPDANGAANALVGLQPSKSVNNEHVSVKKPSAPVKPMTPTNNQAKQMQTIKRPASSVPSPPMKKQKMTSLKDVTYTEAKTSGSLSEFAFFDQVRKTLKNQEIYENFLRCLVIYNQELISKSDLIVLVTPFLSKYAELFKWFKDFLGCKETNNNVEIVPKKIETQERERVAGEFATEIDYSSCIKLGASYRAVPRNYVQPKCSGRTVLCREVLNDTWVSFPSWSEDSTFVSSRKTQFEEYIYRCEDERFELDVVLETNLSTIRILEAEMNKIDRMSSEDKARYRLDDTLGGSSTVIQQRAIKRIYGDKAGDIIEGLKKNPVVAVPLVLKRLKVKDEEWRKVQKCHNKLWRDQNEKYYLKSLDHQGINFKQNDVKNLRSKSILNEIETLYEERHEQIEDGMMDISTGPHQIVFYKCKDIFKDAANLIIHHVKRQTGIHKEDKQKIKQLMRQFFPDFFAVPRGEPSDDEMDKDEDMETEDGNESPKSNVFKNLLSLKNATFSNNSINNHESSNDRISPTQDEKCLDKTFYGSFQNTMDNALPDESYTLMFVNNNWYIFFRLHYILCERLWKFQERSQILISEELKDREQRKQSTAIALRLKPRTNMDIQSYYSAFLDMVKNLLDNNIESSQYEDNLREMFGIHAYLGFTLDKVIQNVVRQLQHIVGDDSCTQWTSLFLDETKNKATGGLCATASQRAAVELAYQKKAEQICEENLFKLIIYKEEGKLTVELLDSDSDTTEDQGTNHKWNAFVKKFSCEEAIANVLKNRLSEKPVFLPRLINNYRKRAKNRCEMEDTESPQDNEIALRNIQDEIDDSKIDLSRLEDGGAGEAVKGLVGLNAKAKFLERTRQNKIAENGSSSSTYGCRFDLNSFKMTWIMDSEQILYRRKCLTKASQSHQKVSHNLREKFQKFHKHWLKENVDEEQETSCRNWLLGLIDDSLPTACIRVDNPLKPPYAPFNRYKVREKT